MSVPRRLAVLLATGLLGLVGAAPALAQSAGDEQYQDPLSQSDGGGEPPALTDEPRAPATGSGEADLSAPPPLELDDEAAGGSDEAGPSRRPAPTQLPNTGSETGDLAAIGAIFVLLGIGLRLRTADARA